MFVYLELLECPEHGGTCGYNVNKKAKKKNKKRKENRITWVYEKGMV